MNSPALSPPINGELRLGDPFDRRAALLIAYNDARKELQRVQVGATSDDILSAEWGVAECLGDLETHEHHLATAKSGSKPTPTPIELWKRTELTIQGLNWDKRSMTAKPTPKTLFDDIDGDQNPESLAN